MKIQRNDHSYSDFLKNKHHPSSRLQRRKSKQDEFKKILEQTLNDQNQDWDEFRVLLPKHGQFWDNGYEDLG